jgi:hypothetical protein
MAALKTGTRVLCGVGYVMALVLALVAVFVLQLAYNQDVHRAISIPVVLWHALPILTAKFCVDALYGGPDAQGAGAAGALTYVAAVLVYWWFLPAMACAPRLWASRSGRNVVKAYVVGLAVVMVGAAIWLALDPSLMAS